MIINAKNRSLITFILLVILLSLSFAVTSSSFAACTGGASGDISCPDSSLLGNELASQASGGDTIMQCQGGASGDTSCPDSLPGLLTVSDLGQQTLDCNGGASGDPSCPDDDPIILGTVDEGHTLACNGGANGDSSCPD